MNDSPNEYADLLRRLEQGDPTARAALIERAQDQLRLRVHQMLAKFPTVHGVHATSDVLQEVLLELSEMLRQLTPRDGRHFMGLAGQRIRWKLLDLARRRPVPLQATDGELGAAEQITYDPARLAQWEEVHSYIQELPDAERELFDLIFYQGMPQEAVATMLGEPYRSLKRRWQEARLRFMTRFAGGPF
jgi:RNA polymerase sigma factor (sigma-70 family)